MEIYKRLFSFILHFLYDIGLNGVKIHENGIKMELCNKILHL